MNQAIKIRSGSRDRNRIETHHFNTYSRYDTLE